MHHLGSIHNVNVELRSLPSRKGCKGVGVDKNTNDTLAADPLVTILPTSDDFGAELSWLDFDLGDGFVVMYNMKIQDVLNLKRIILYTQKQIHK